MVQEPETRQNEPRYSCRVALESLTGNPHEEVIALATTPEASRWQAEQVLVSSYHFSPEQIAGVMQQAVIESLATWCAPKAADTDG